MKDKQRKRNLLFILTLLLAIGWQTSSVFAVFNHNSNIVFGSIIRLRHRNTDKYLASGEEKYKDLVRNGQVWVDSSEHHAVYAVKYKKVIH